VTREKIPQRPDARERFLGEREETTMSDWIDIKGEEVLSLRKRGWDVEYRSPHWDGWAAVTGSTCIGAIELEERRIRARPPQPQWVECTDKEAAEALERGEEVEARARNHNTWFPVCYSIGFQWRNDGYAVQHIVGRRFRRKQVAK